MQDSKINHKHRPGVKEWCFFSSCPNKIYKCKKCGSNIKINESKKTFYFIFILGQYFFNTFIGLFLVEMLSDKIILKLDEFTYLSKTTDFVIEVLLVIVILPTIYFIADLINSHLFKFEKVNDE